MGLMFMIAFTSSHCWRRTTILVRRACIFCSSSAKFASRVSCLLVAEQLNGLIFGPLICSMVIACLLVSLVVACVDWLVLRYNKLLRGLQYYGHRNIAALNLTYLASCSSFDSELVFTATFPGTRVRIPILEIEHSPIDHMILVREKPQIEQHGC